MLPQPVLPLKCYACPPHADQVSCLALPSARHPEMTPCIVLLFEDRACDLPSGSFSLHPFGPWQSPTSPLHGAPVRTGRQEGGWWLS